MEEQTNSNVAVVDEQEGKGKAGRPFGSFKKATDKSSFLKPSGHEFDKVIKKSAKHIEDVMEALANIATSKDATNNERTAAAKEFMTNMNRMVEQRNKDDIQRKIAEIRVRGSVGGGSTADDEEDDMAVIDFDTIPDEFKDSEAKNAE